MAAPLGPVKFWKPGTEGPGVSISEERQSLAENSATTFVYNPYAALSIEQQRQKLPVFKLRNHILYLIENYQTVVIVGETGCGKSTQIPQYLAEAGWTAEGRVVGVTQPRRVAAVTVAGRVAEERGAMLGHEVGYCIRFDDCTNPLATRIKFLTDGMLVREMMVDPLLTKYSVIMLDEAHERTLYTDIAIGLLKKIQKKRGDLRLIVASATLDAEKFWDFFNQNDTSDPTRDTCVILTVEGRTFPVDIFYLQSPVPDYIKSTVETVMKIHQTEGDGDILAFLTGQEEVETVVSMLIEQARALGRTGMKRHLRVLPMYAGLPSFEQMKVFERVSRTVRKVIVATNVAETSITISGIVYVIDCGFVKLRAYNPRTAIECLVVVPVSQASASQRAGRGGRSRSGKCYRLYTEEAFDQLPQSTVPEMQRSNLAPVILQLKALGIDNVLRFHFMSPPPAQSMVQALELLYALGGLDKDCRLTEPLGMRIAEFPLNPMFAKMLLESGNFGCSQEILSIAAMMQIQNVFVVPSNQKSQAIRVHRKFAVEEGDHLTMLNVYEAFIKHNKNSQWCQEHFLNYKGLVRAVTVREQLKKLLVKFQVPKKSSEGDPDPVLRCIVSGFFANAARFHSTGAYRTIRDDHELHIHPASVLYAEKPPRWVIYNEVIQTSKYYMRDVTAIESAWLLELAPHFYQQGTVGMNRACPPEPLVTCLFVFLSTHLFSSLMS
ncbi:probable ATP-dependent RNA helicase DHX35 isoform X1 [Physeter macrocephalus]|uniref:Probable ATP-dependent RNA helicase DHX35 n=1 Tax=Physeter macrocephalus TaxID=9755 RepID=A0A2Y9T7X1_PHYMC|nr:probable ATP-dependent RNA helicase DHX35 isoform X1 [Physeter catodon]|eukprot:XP_023984194.1 probable ATP-dependent RNA helicase DHX35 isoform X1 [Physeter catodon]